MKKKRKNVKKIEKPSIKENSLLCGLDQCGNKVPMRRCKLQASLK
jgi:hypothetical protein